MPTVFCCKRLIVAKSNKGKQPCKTLYLAGRTQAQRKNVVCTLILWKRQKRKPCSTLHANCPKKQKPQQKLRFRVLSVWLVSFLYNAMLSHLDRPCINNKITNNTKAAQIFFRFCHCTVFFNTCIEFCDNGVSFPPDLHGTVPCRWGRLRSECFGTVQFPLRKIAC